MSRNKMFFPEFYESSVIFCTKEKALYFPVLLQNCCLLQYPLAFDNKKKPTFILQQSNF